MIALCIKDELAPRHWNFIEGKFYEVEKKDSSRIAIIDEDKKPVWMDSKSVLAESFRLLECDSCTYRKCNTCPIDKEKL